MGLFIYNDCCMSNPPTNTKKTKVIGPSHIRVALGVLLLALALLFLLSIPTRLFYGLAWIVVFPFGLVGFYMLGGLFIGLGLLIIFTKKVPQKGRIRIILGYLLTMVTLMMFAAHYGIGGNESWSTPSQFKDIMLNQWPSSAARYKDWRVGGGILFWSLDALLNDTAGAWLIILIGSLLSIASFLTLFYPLIVKLLKAIHASVVLAKAEREKEKDIREKEEALAQMKREKEAQGQFTPSETDDSFFRSPAIEAQKPAEEASPFSPFASSPLDAFNFTPAGDFDLPSRSALRNASPSNSADVSVGPREIKAEPISNSGPIRLSGLQEAIFNPTPEETAPVVTEALQEAAPKKNPAPAHQASPADISLNNEASTPDYAPRFDEEEEATTAAPLPSIAPSPAYQSPAAPAVREAPMPASFNDDSLFSAFAPRLEEKQEALVSPLPSLSTPIEDGNVTSPACQASTPAPSTAPSPVYEAPAAEPAPAPVYEAPAHVNESPSPAPVMPQPVIAPSPASAASNPLPAASAPAPAKEEGPASEFGFPEEYRQKPAWVPPDGVNQPLATPLPPYEAPGPELLKVYADEGDVNAMEEECAMRTAQINETLNNLHAGAQVVSHTIGPSVTRYDIRTDSNVSVSSLSRYITDLSVRLGGVAARFSEVVEGKDTSALEIVNSKKRIVPFSEVYGGLRDPAKHPLDIPFGVNIEGKVICADLADFPHMLVAGTTGSGKSIFIHGIIMSLIMRNRPEDLKVVMVDPKRVEFAKYHDIGHLLCPIIKEPSHAKIALKKLCEEMDRRYGLFESAYVSNITEFNNDYCPANNRAKLPYIVLFVDEYADLVDQAKEVQDYVLRIAQKARACGIHMVIATQRPDVKVITGTIKSNLPTRVALTVASAVDSMTIINQAGAEELAGHGDMLIDCGKVSRNLVRCQGCMVDNREILNVTNHIREQQKVVYDPAFLDLEDHEAEQKAAAEAASANAPSFQELRASSNEERYQQIKRAIMAEDSTSVSKIQHQFGVGYPRAAEIFKRLQEEGIVAPKSGAPNSSKGCEVLVHDPDALNSMGAD